MSSSSHCQGLPSCLEPANLAEPHVMSLKLAPNSHISPPLTASRKDSDDGGSKRSDTIEMGGWSFLQSLTTNDTKDTAIENDKCYIPQNMRRSSSMLQGEKSLEMCTESLGSETGSEISSDEMMSVVTLENVRYGNERRGRESWKLGERRRKKRRGSIPPPLSSSSRVQVRGRRERGRLVLEAVKVSPCSHTYLHAERGNGRLKLHIMVEKEEEAYKEEKWGLEVENSTEEEEEAKDGEKEEDEEEEEEAKEEEEEEEEKEEEAKDGEREEEELGDEDLEVNNGKGVGKWGGGRQAAAAGGGAWKVVGVMAMAYLLNWDLFWVVTENNPSPSNPTISHL